MSATSTAYPSRPGGAALGWTSRSFGRFKSIGRLERISLISAVALTLFLAVAPAVLPHGPQQVVGAPLESPNGTALLGTDDLGRDLLTRTIYGMRTSWFAVFPVIVSGLLVGGLVGALAGFFGGWLDTLLMRLTDLWLALPSTLITIAIALSLGRGLENTLLAIMVTFWPPYARIMRGEVRRLMAMPNVEAAQLGGISRRRLVGRHVVPGLSGSMLVQASLDVSTVILTLAGLAFLGFGQLPPAPDLGSMTSKDLGYLFTAWWVPVVPSIGVCVLALIGNLSGDAVSDLANSER